MRQAAIEAEELRIVGMRWYRRALLRYICRAWIVHHEKAAIVKAACRQARAQLAVAYSRTLLYRLGLCVMSMLAELMHDDIRSARYRLERGTLQRCVMQWRIVTSEAQLRRKHLAYRSYARCL